jgi:Uma2 family endonuclease
MPEATPMTVQIQKRLFTVDEYRQMGRAGILGDDDRVELIQGEIVQMSPIGRRHAACVNRLNQLLSRRVGDSAIVSVQNPVSLSQHSEPQPDVALLRPRSDFYASRHPGPDDVLLIVEVAETSPEFDREVKMPLYAGAGIQEVWLVDLSEGNIQIYRSATAGGYEHVQTFASGQHLTPQTLPQLRVSTDEILG